MSTKQHLSWAVLDDFDAKGTDKRRMCPFCGEGKTQSNANRSLSIDPDTGLWKCFRCSEGGKLMDYWENRTGTTQQRISRVKTAYRFDFAGSFRLEEPETVEVKIPPVSYLSTCPDFATEYLRCERHISYETAMAAGTGFSPSWYGGPAAVFYVYDMDGNIVACQGRFTTSNRHPSSITVGPKRLGMFCTSKPDGPGWIGRLPFLILCEAPIDALSLAEAGYPALAFCGSTGPDWLIPACGMRQVFLGFDNDEPDKFGTRAGERSSDNVMRMVKPYGAYCTRLRPVDGCKDWNDMLKKYGKIALADWLATQIL